MGSDKPKMADVWALPLKVEEEYEGDQEYYFVVDADGTEVFVGAMENEQEAKALVLAVNSYDTQAQTIAGFEAQLGEAKKALKEIRLMDENPRPNDYSRGYNHALGRCQLLTRKGLAAAGREGDGK